MTNGAARVTLYRRVPKSETCKFGLQELAADEALFRKPTLLCCGGVETNAADPKHARNANGMCKIGHSLLGMDADINSGSPYDIVSVSYPHNEPYLRAELKEYNDNILAGRPYKAYSDFAERFAAEQLLPLVNNVSFAQAKKNLRNVNILAHSYGGAFVQQVGNALFDGMKTLGYSESQIKEATSQICVVIAGNGATIGACKAAFTTLDIASFDDVQLREHYEPEPAPTAYETLPRLLQKPLREAGRLDEKSGLPKQLRSILPIGFDAGGGAPRFTHEPGSNYYLFYVSPPAPGARAIRLDMPRVAPFATAKEFDAYDHVDEKGHAAQLYFYPGIGTNGYVPPLAISCVLGNALYNSLDNADGKPFTPLPNMLDLLKAPKEIRHPAPKGRDFAAMVNNLNYNQQIAQAAGIGQAPLRG